MSLSVVIPTRDTFELTQACVASVLKESIHANSDDANGPLQIVVVDDGGTDDVGARITTRWPTVESLRLFPGEGFSAAANRGLAAARGDLVLLLNSDTELRPGSLSALSRAFVDPRVGIVGGALFYPDGSPQWSGGGEPTLLWLLALTSGLGRLRRRRPHSANAAFEDRAWVTGAALATRRRIVAECGPLSDDFHFYAQDLDFCLRVRDRGWLVGIAPAFAVLHHHGATIGGGEAALRGQQRLEFLWPDLLRAYSRRHGAGAARLARGFMLAGGLVAVIFARLRRDAARRETLRRALRALSRERLDIPVAASG